MPVSSWLYGGWSWRGMWNPAVSQYPGPAQQCRGEQDDGGDHDRDGDRDNPRSPVGGRGRVARCEGQDRHVVLQAVSLVVVLIDDPSALATAHRGGAGHGVRVIPLPNRLTRAQAEAMT